MTAVATASCACGCIGKGVAVSEARIDQLQPGPAPLPIRQGAAMAAPAGPHQPEPIVRDAAGAPNDWVTLPVMLARCLAAVRVGHGAKAQVAIDVGHDLLRTAEALRGLAKAGLIERRPGSWDWHTTPRGKACMISITPDTPLGRQGGRGILRPNTAATRLLQILDRPMRGRELAKALGVTRQRVHQIVVRELATGRLRCGDPGSPLLIVARADDPSLLLDAAEEQALSALAATEAATVRRMASRCRMSQPALTLLADTLKAKGLFEIALDPRGQLAWRLTSAGATHVQRRTRQLARSEPRGPVRSHRVSRVLGYLAEHGPCRARDLAVAVGVEFHSMNALIQQLKRRGIVAKDGDGHIAGHGLTQHGRAVLAELRRRGAVAGGTVGTRQAAR
jgi:DNA-binding MarR family transcriptional regulator